VAKGSRRIDLAELYVLHHRPWRDTSRMLDVFTREHGRLTLFARGVRGPKSRSASVLQPFRPLLGSWTLTGDAGQLNQVESAPAAGEWQPLPAAALIMPSSRIVWKSASTIAFRSRVDLPLLMPSRRRELMRAIS